MITGGLVQISCAEDTHGREISKHYFFKRRLKLDDTQKLQVFLRSQLTANGLAPTVDGASCYDIGVSRSKYSRNGFVDPYVARRVDTQLREALLGEPFVLLVGFSKAGKSRTFFEALRTVMPDARLLVPKGDPSIPARLLSFRSSLIKDGERGVLWLDDLDRFLAIKGIDLVTLEELRLGYPPIFIAATVRSKRRDDVLTAPEK